MSVMRDDPKASAHPQWLLSRTQDLLTCRRGAVSQASILQQISPQRVCDLQPLFLCRSPAQLNLGLRGNGLTNIAGWSRISRRLQLQLAAGPESKIGAQA
jgi:hypothetical protein